MTRKAQALRWRNQWKASQRFHQKQTRRVNRKSVLLRKQTNQERKKQKRGGA